jgi:hypothetical protein
MNDLQMIPYGYRELTQKLNILPFDAQAEIKDFIDFLFNKYKDKPHNDLLRMPPKAGCMRGSFVWMSDDFNAPLEDFNDYQ